MSVFSVLVAMVTKTANPTKEVWKLPSKGVSDEELLSQLEVWKEQDEARWSGGQASGAVYHGGQEHMEVINRAMGMFSVGNPLHGDLWPSLVKMEAEVISMTAGLVGGGDAGDPGVCGVMTSGGTESIFQSIKAHRQQAERERGVTAPEVVCCITAHAAVEKACDIMRIKMIEVPHTSDFKVDLAAMEHHVNSNTIMLYASAPTYAHGIIDPVEDMADIALRFGVGLHVDCCLGGFVLPFAKSLRPGTISAFDFSVPGVTAMSCDTHKYGYAVKGTSVALFRDKALRKHSYYVSPEWTGGKYITATPAGSRPGGASAAAWASLMRLGEEGLRDAADQILSAAERFAAGICAIEGLQVLGDPKAMMVAVGSEDLDIHAVGRAAKKRGGFGLSSCQHPPCIHLCTTLRHVPQIDAILKAVAEGVDDVRRSGKKKGASSADIYGVTDGSISRGATRSVDDALSDYMDSVLDMPSKSKL